jgi:hypothetical protein
MFCILITGRTVSPAVVKQIYFDKDLDKSIIYEICISLDEWEFTTKDEVYFSEKRIISYDEYTQISSDNSIFFRELNSTDELTLSMNALKNNTLAFYYNGKHKQIVFVKDSLDEQETDIHPIILHELGHSLGLNHDLKYNTIMYRSISHISNGITQDDVDQFCDVNRCYWK